MISSILMKLQPTRGHDTVGMERSLRSLPIDDLQMEFDTRLSVSRYGFSRIGTITHPDRHEALSGALAPIEGQPLLDLFGNVGAS